MQPAVEFLLIGGLTPVVLPLLWCSRRALGLDSAELLVGFVTFHAATFINDPHFAATYLLFYRDLPGRAFGNSLGPAGRRRYWVAGLVVPLALAAALGSVLARDSRQEMGLLFQLMFLLVGWHYVKQGFGVLVVLAARRGFRFTGLERGALLLHCYASWAYGWASPADLGTDYVLHGIAYTSLTHPFGLEQLTRIVFLGSALGLAFVLWRRWRREGLPWGPLAGLLVTCWLWTVYTSLDPLFKYVLPALHSVQYLYFVWLLKSGESKQAESSSQFKGVAKRQLYGFAVASIALGWLLLRGMPEALDEVFVLHDASDPAGLMGLGATPYFAAFFTFVNLHHYFMDNVIWRRDNPQTRYLLVS